MTINEDRLMAQLDLVAEIVKISPDCKIYDVTRGVAKLAGIARSLRKCYEASCSYEWVCTDKYARYTDRLEASALSIAVEPGITVGLQRDPRGWPLIVQAGAYETRPG